MSERQTPSVEELFRDSAPYLLEFLSSNDIFWNQVRDNSITETELRGHQVLLEESGRTPEDSAVLKAIYEIRRLRQSALPTPIEFYLRNSPRN
jgi:hypothetical protein